MMMSWEEISVKSKTRLTLVIGLMTTQLLSILQSNPTYKKTRTWLSSWAFSQLETFLKHTSTTQGIAVVNAEPRYTSQKYNDYKTITKKARQKSIYIDVFYIETLVGQTLNSGGSQSVECSDRGVIAKRQALAG
jgi:hypothetical protein